MRQWLMGISIVGAILLLGGAVWMLQGEPEPEDVSLSEAVEGPGAKKVSSEAIEYPALPADEAIPVSDERLASGSGRLFGQVFDPGGEPVSKGEVWVYLPAGHQLEQMLAQFSKENHQQVFEQLRRNPEAARQLAGAAKRVRRVKTDEDGRYRITDLAGGTYFVDAAAGQECLAEPVRVELDEQTGRELDLRLAVGSTVTIYVRDQLGYPVPEARVALDATSGPIDPAAGIDPVGTSWGIRDPLERRSGKTDEKGRLVLTGLRAGQTYRPEAEAKEYYLPSELQPIVVTSNRELTIAMIGFTVLSGVVIAPDGQPAAKAIVRVDGQTKTQCDEAGQFRLGELRVGEAPLTLFAATEDLDGIAKETVSLVRGEKREGLRILLQKSARVRGIVRDRRGQPIIGAQVSASAVSGDTVSFEQLVSFGNMNVSNRFEVSPHLLSTGEISFSFESVEVDGAASIEIIEEETETVETFVDEPFEVSSSPMQVQQFESITSLSEIPLQDIDSIFQDLSRNGSWRSLGGGSSRSTVTDENGEYEILGLWPGDYSVTSSAKGYLPSEAPMVVHLPVMGAEERADFELTRGAVIEGTTFGPDGQPLANVDVFVLQGDNYVSTISTDEKGHYLADGIPGGTYDLYARTGAYELLGQGRGFVVEVEREYQGVDFHLLPGGRITGVVTDASGRPVPSANVQVSTMVAGQVDRTASADPDGNFLIENLYDGEYRLVASANEFLPTTIESISILRGDLHRQDVRLSQGSTLSGQVLDPRGMPVAGAHVFVHDTTGRKLAQTNPLGEYSVSQLAPGPCRVYVRTDDYTLNAYRELTLQPEEQRGMFDLRLVGGARVTGRILSRGVLPKEGLGVEAKSVPLGNVTRQGAVSNDGSFVIENLYEGTYKVYIRGRADQFVTIEVGPGGETSEVSLTFDD
ncbi:MAG: carboxypeptidase-like regulatory domain-containing protein [Planctomycetota bacterium]